MNSTTAKCAKWYARVLGPKAIDDSFWAKGGEIQARKRQYVLA